MSTIVLVTCCCSCDFLLWSTLWLLLVIIIIRLSYKCFDDIVCLFSNTREHSSLSIHRSNWIGVQSTRVHCIEGCSEFGERVGHRRSTYTWYDIQSTRSCLSICMNTCSFKWKLQRANTVLLMNHVEATYENFSRGRQKSEMHFF